MNQYKASQDVLGVRSKYGGFLAQEFIALTRTLELVGWFAHNGKPLVLRK